MHEAQLHRRNCFITLTYNDEHLPRPGSLVPGHLRDFFKRARHVLGPFRYFACGEYGDLNWRPHYHALLFGVDFPDRQPFKKRGDTIAYVSATLSRLWHHKGFCSVGEVTPQSAAYCARYALKKVGGEQAEFYYSELDPYTGELVPIEPEFSRMSLKPGIGARWFEKFGGDVFPSDEAVLQGKRWRVPDYYDTLFERASHGPSRAGKALISEIKDKRKARAIAQALKRPDGLEAREKVLKAKISKLKREV